MSLVRGSEAGESIADYRLLCRSEPPSAGKLERWLAVPKKHDAARRTFLAERLIASIATRDDATNFLRRAELRARNPHPSLPAAVTTGTEGRAPYAIYEYVPGIELDALLEILEGRDQLLPLPVAARIAIQLAAAIDHGQQTFGEDVQRRLPAGDVAPETVLISWDGNIIFTGFCDVAELAEDGTVVPDAMRWHGERTEARALWTAPEQLFGARVNHSTDIFSIGAILYQMVTGRNPFEGPTEKALDRVKYLKYDRASVLTERADRELDTIIARCLVPARDRYRDAGELSAAIERWASRVGSAQAAEISALARDSGAVRWRDEARLVAQLTTSPRFRKRAPVEKSDMVFIPAGPFKFGETPNELIKLEAFYIDRTLVSNRDYAAYLQATNRPPPVGWPGGVMPPGKESHPVVKISYNEALSYAEWLGKRLPTEEEWEKAARGVDARIWPWGNAFDQALCSAEWKKPHEKRETEPIGSRSPAADSFFNVADLCLVWEWTSTWWIGRRHKVVRGGAWRNVERPPNLLNRSFEDDGGLDVGFRCACDA